MPDPLLGLSVYLYPESALGPSQSSPGLAAGSWVSTESQRHTALTVLNTILLRSTSITQYRKGCPENFINSFIFSKIPRRNINRHSLTFLSKTFFEIMQTQNILSQQTPLPSYTYLQLVIIILNCNKEGGGNGGIRSIRYMQDLCKELLSCYNTTVCFQQ